MDKPALLRQLFRLGCDYSGQVLSYQKILGQLQDAGNTTTLAHYLELLAGAGMLTGLQKFSGSREVDFVLRRAHRLTAIEVTSGRRRNSLSGLGAFAGEFRPTRKVLVGGQGVPLGEFLAEPAANWAR